MQAQNDAHRDEHRRRIEAARTRVRVLAHWLDGIVAVPGTRFRFGIDSVIGLIPGVGDFAGLLLGTVILAEGLRVGAPNHLIARMVSNALADGVAGAVPVLGDVFDFAFRSNARNARLLLDHLDRHADASAPIRPARRGPLLALVLLVPVAVFALAVYGMVVAFQKLAS